MIEISLISLIACHFIADFPLQSEWFALNKGKSHEVMLYHCIVYTCAFLLILKISVLSAIILLVTHFIIDTLKARYKIIPTIWIDQILHLTIILIVYYRGIV